MVKKKELSMLVIGAVILVASYFYLDTSDTLFGVISDKITPVNWDEVKSREIVKNSISIELLETNGNSCKVTAEAFDLIIDHKYFVRSSELAEKLHYDENTNTLTIPCDELKGEKSRLNVWYVVEESPKHSLKYEYFVTLWDEQKSPGV